MSNSIQTNVSSIISQENLRINNEFQNATINRLTSGYRINSSSDDAAGLAVANQFRSDITEMQQGVRNANDGLSQLQIIDGGLNNISKILDRMKTLATQSASGTFTGSRETLNNEFTTLKDEIDRQASNIRLVSGGTYNTAVSVYIGGGVGQTNSTVSFDLSGVSGRADSASLGLASSLSVNAGLTGVKLAGAAIDLSTGTFLVGAGAKQTFEVTVGGQTLANIEVTGTGAGITGQQAVDQLNTKLASYGITASIDSTSGQLQFNSSNAFVIRANTAITGIGAIATVGAASTATNAALYNVTQAFATVADDAQTLSFTVGGNTTAVALAVADTVDTAVQKINTALNSKGIYAISDGNGNLSLQSAEAFTLTGTKTTATSGFVVDGTDAAGTATINAPDSTLNADATLQAKAALAAISTAVTSLGSLQGRVGTAQNKLQYALQLAQSQISSYSAAESRIRDADIATEAANLTKGQVLQQASLAALAQANSAPQALLALLRG